MANLQDRRETIRQAYSYRCGYCGVKEEEAGSELEIDHFRPRSASGTDDVNNLVYCCPTCNRFKGDFWPVDDANLTHRRLLHPQRDDLATHLRAEVDGRLSPLTETAAFYIERLRLNRPPLVALRRSRQEQAQLRQELADAQAEQIRLRARIKTLDNEIAEVLTQIARFLEA